jgi:hypothetical protein
MEVHAIIENSIERLRTTIEGDVSELGASSDMMWLSRNRTRPRLLLVNNDTGKSPRRPKPQPCV